MMPLFLWEIASFVNLSAIRRLIVLPEYTRHSWATLAAELDIPKETISAGLGHEIGSDVTSIYIKFDQKKVDDANRRVIDYVFGKEKAGK